VQPLVAVPYAASVSRAPGSDAACEVIYHLACHARGAVLLVARIAGQFRRAPGRVALTGGACLAPAAGRWRGWCLPASSAGRCGARGARVCLLRLTALPVGRQRRAAGRRVDARWDRAAPAGAAHRRVRTRRPTGGLACPELWPLVAVCAAYLSRCAATLTRSWLDPVSSRRGADRSAHFSLRRKQGTAPASCASSSRRRGRRSRCSQLVLSKGRLRG
jgi:hypothetical protein